jgi:tetratricopeptide (TPR) repeat protein
MAPRIYSESTQSRLSSVALQSAALAPDDSILLQESVFQESVQQVRRRVSQAVDQGDFIRAIALLNRLITQFPANAEDYNNRGLVHFWQGAFHKAVLDFNRAIALNPDLPAAYNNRANYYAAKGAKESALEDYERTIDLDPFHVRARINRAITLRELGRYDLALDGFEEALLFRQKAGEIYAERGRTYHLRGDWNCAIADYYRAIAVFDRSSSETSTPLPRLQRQIMVWLQELTPAA